MATNVNIFAGQLVCGVRARAFELILGHLMAEGSVLATSRRPSLLEVPRPQARATTPPVGEASGSVIGELVGRFVGREGLRANSLGQATALGGCPVRLLRRSRFAKARWSAGKTRFPCSSPGVSIISTPPGYLLRPVRSMTTTATMQIAVKAPSAFIVSPWPARMVLAHPSGVTAQFAAVSHSNPPRAAVAPPGGRVLVLSQWFDRPDS